MSVLILAMIQDQALVASRSKHFLVETKDQTPSPLERLFGKSDYSAHPDGPWKAPRKGSNAGGPVGGTRGSTHGNHTWNHNDYHVEPKYPYHWHPYPYPGSKRTDNHYRFEQDESLTKSATHSENAIKSI